MNRQRGAVRAGIMFVRVGSTLVAGAVATACHSAPEVIVSRTHIQRLLEAKTDTGLALRAAMKRDTVEIGDKAPVEVLYAVINGPRPVPLENTPGRYQIVVTGPDGKPATSLGGSGPVTGMMEGHRVPLPAGGVLIQRQDLRCVNDASYSAVPVVPSSNDCLAMYALSVPGKYRVAVEYFGPQNADQSAATKSSAPRGMHLTDTTTFVVVAR